MWKKKKILHNLSEILGIVVGRIMAAPKMSLKPVNMLPSWPRGIKVANWLPEDKEIVLDYRGGTNVISGSYSFCF